LAIGDGGDGSDSSKSSRDDRDVEGTGGCGSQILTLADDCQFDLYRLTSPRQELYSQNVDSLPKLDRHLSQGFQCGRV